MLDFNKLINYKFSIIFNEYTYNTGSDFFNDGKTDVPDFLADGLDFGQLMSHTRARTQPSSSVVADMIISNLRSQMISMVVVRIGLRY